MFSFFFYRYSSPLSCGQSDEEEAGDSVDPTELLTGDSADKASTETTGGTGTNAPTRQSSRPGRGQTNRFADFDTTGEGGNNYVPATQEDTEVGTH